MPIKDGVKIKESSLTSGTGTLDLEGAEYGHNTLADEIGDGNSMVYLLLDANGLAWEMGVGTLTAGSPDTFSRDTVLRSSNSDSLVALSSPSGSNKHLLINAPVPGYATGDVDFLANALFNVKDKVQTPDISSGVLTLNYKLGGMAVVTLDENVTSITVSNVPAGGAMTVYFVQDATGGRTVDFSGFKTAGGEGITLSTDADARDIVVFITSDGTNYDAGLYGAAFA